MEDSRRRGRRVLLVLAAIFLLPVAVSFALYYGKLWRPAGSASKGELIDPRPVLAGSLRSPDGKPADQTVFTGKWSLIYVGDGACNQDCRQALVFARQSRLALNNEMTRVQRIFLVTANCCDTAYLAQEHAGLITLDASGAGALLAQFPGDQPHSLYIVDPLGNLMMRHDASHTSKDLLTDLKKLLKLSHIG